MNHSLLLQRQKPRENVHLSGSIKTRGLACLDFRHERWYYGAEDIALIANSPQVVNRLGLKSRNRPIWPDGNLKSPRPCYKVWRFPWPSLPCQFYLRQNTYQIIPSAYWEETIQFPTLPVLRNYYLASTFWELCDEEYNLTMRGCYQLPGCIQPNPLQPTARRKEGQLLLITPQQDQCPSNPGRGLLLLRFRNVKERDQARDMSPSSRKRFVRRGIRRRLKMGGRCCLRGSLLKFDRQAYMSMSNQICARTYIICLL